MQIHKQIKIQIRISANTNTITDTNQIIKLQNDMTGGMCFLLLTGGDEEKLSCVQRFLHFPVFHFQYFYSNIPISNIPFPIFLPKVSTFSNIPFPIFLLQILVDQYLQQSSELLASPPCLRAIISKLRRCGTRCTRSSR